MVWITRYRYKVLRGKLQSRVREIIAQVADEMHIEIFNGVVSSGHRCGDHIHIFCSIPPHTTVSLSKKLEEEAPGRGSRKVQQEFPELKKRYGGNGYIIDTNSNVTDDVINEYIDNHIDAHKSDNRGEPSKQYLFRVNLES